MTHEILLVLSILLFTSVLLVTKWLPMELTAWLTLGLVAPTGLLPPVKTHSGFQES